MAFHPYPQLIRALCNGHRFGPPAPLTAPSTWPWVAHPVSGLPRATVRPLRTRCRCGSGSRCLSLAARGLSPVRSTKSTPSLAEASSDWLRARGFRSSFTPLGRGAFHRSLAVLCAIGRHRYLALEGGPPSFPRATSFPVVLAHASRRGAGFRLRGSHPLWRTLPGPSSSQGSPPSGPRQQATDAPHNPRAATPAGLSTARV